MDNSDSTLRIAFLSNNAQLFFRNSYLGLSIELLHVLYDHLRLLRVRLSLYYP